VYLPGTEVSLEGRLHLSHCSHCGDSVTSVVLNTFLAFLSSRIVTVYRLEYLDVKLSHAVMNIITLERWLSSGL
jgi:hypothetical protein